MKNEFSTVNSRRPGEKKRGEQDNDRPALVHVTIPRQGGSEVDPAELSLGSTRGPVKITKLRRGQISKSCNRNLRKQRWGKVL